MKNIKKITIALVLVLSFCFSFVSAATNADPAAGACPTITNIGSLFEYAICLLQGFVVPFLVAIALVMFLAGIVKYVASGDNEEKKDAGKGLMIFGIIALFVMVGVWGLVKILYTTILPGKAFEVPNLPPQATSPFQ